MRNASSAPSGDAWPPAYPAGGRARRPGGQGSTPKASGVPGPYVPRCSPGTAGLVRSGSGCPARERALRACAAQPAGSRLPARLPSEAADNAPGKGDNNRQETGSGRFTSELRDCIPLEGEKRCWKREAKQPEEGREQIITLHLGGKKEPVYYQIVFIAEVSLP